MSIKLETIYLNLVKRQENGILLLYICKYLKNGDQIIAKMPVSIERNIEGYVKDFPSRFVYSNIAYRVDCYSYSEDVMKELNRLGSEETRNQKYKFNYNLSKKIIDLYNGDKEIKLQEELLPISEEEYQNKKKNPEFRIRYTQNH